jgi:hypothetical protein
MGTNLACDSAKLVARFDSRREVELRASLHVKGLGGRRIGWRPLSITSMSVRLGPWALTRRHSHHHHPPTERAG